jgi:hypothetical protein
MVLECNGIVVVVVLDGMRFECGSNECLVGLKEFEGVLEGK